MLSWRQLIWVLSISLLLTFFERCQHHTVSGFRTIGIYSVISSFFFFIWSGYNVWVYPTFFSSLRSLPSPPQKALWRRFFKEPTPWLFEKWQEEVPNDGIIRYFGIFNQERLLLTTPRAVRDVLKLKTYDFEKQKGQKTHLTPVLGRGLVLAEGQAHRLQRKQMSSGFQSSSIRALQPLFWEKTKDSLDHLAYDIRVSSLKDNPGIDCRPSAIVEVQEPVSRTALDIIGVAACSFDFQSLKNPQKHGQLLREYRKVFGVSFSNKIRCVLALVLPSWLVDRVPIKRNREIHHAVRLIERLARKIIFNKRIPLETKPMPSSIVKASNAGDIIDKLKESAAVSDNAVLHQLKTLLAAGHDTTSSTLASAAAVLSQPRYRTIQARLRQEIHNRVGIPAKEVAVSSLSDLENMPYLNAVQNEIWRLYPPFSWFYRRSVVSTSICGFYVPADTNITLCPWALHRSKQIWGPNADQFNPNRWLDDPTGKGGAQDSYSFLTFGAGPRVCIAEQFARKETATILAGIFGSFEIEAVPGLRPSPLSHQLTLTHMGGVRVRMSQLDSW